MQTWTAYLGELLCMRPRAREETRGEKQEKNRGDNASGYHGDPDPKEKTEGKAGWKIMGKKMRIYRSDAG